MKSLSSHSEKDNRKKTIRQISKTNTKGRFFEDAIEAIALALSQEVSEKCEFAEFEKTLLEICNEASRRILSARLENISRQYQNDYLLINRTRYTRHAIGEVEYHSLCGSMKIERYTYRETSVRNGPTVVPMELVAGLIERATPALAFRAALGDAQCPGRQWEEQLRASHRRPPSRSTLERMAKKIGDTVKHSTPEILPVVRGKEKLHRDAIALSVGLDRTTIPMEEKLRSGDIRDPSLKRRKKPYIRKPPLPVEVNYRMGYVGTVSIIGEDGENMRTNRYGCSADMNPEHILKMMMDDLIHIQTERNRCGLSNLPIGIIQDGAPEMWNLVEEAANKAFPGKHFHKGIDRFHLMERLAESLKALRDPFRRDRDVTLNKWRLKLETDDHAIRDIERQLIKETKRDKSRKQLSAANAEILRANLTYINNNKHLMQYVSLRKKGLPTGSGATEGACKSLIMMRAKGCGQRWHSRGINAVLTLRGLYLSDRLPLFWNAMCNLKTVNIQVAA